jgi:hypothetical protein
MALLLCQGRWQCHIPVVNDEHGWESLIRDYRSIVYMGLPENSENIQNPASAKEIRVLPRSRVVDTREFVGVRKQVVERTPIILEMIDQTYQFHCSA